MEMIPKRYETVADIPVDEFLPLQKIPKKNVNRLLHLL